MTLPLLVFAATYLMISVQRIPGLHLNRPAASLLGAVAMVVVAGLPLGEAYAAIDLDVLVFLLGVMILVAYLELGGFFEWAAGWVLPRVRTQRQLMVAVLMGSAALSALFVNDTVCLMLTPVLLATLVPLGIRPVPYLIALAMGANIGSALTVVGNPQNMLIGLWSGVPFASFSWRMTPVVVGGLGIATAILLLVYRRELAGPLPDRVHIGEPALDRRIVFTALALFAGALLAWLLGGSLPLVAIVAGALMIALGRQDPGPALAKVDWPLLLFFGSLFVVMRGLAWSGAADALDRVALSAVAPDAPFRSAVSVTAAMTALSNLISNVPAVLLWRNVVPTLPDPERMWLMVSMSSTFAGNLLLIGSMANLIVAERAAARGVHIGFWEYARAGVPICLLTLGWGVLVLTLG
ncbi:MAG TPA: anion transporter [Gemmatimonadales bacterium]|nr:anion transporter [Gemmatimonadales bacterium]HRZ08839.1 anion transporter [Gemmatimonadales bacterium]